MIVLVADDLFTSRVQIGLVLKALGYKYDEAVNGDDAIDKLKQNDYAFILMDIEMPVRNGLETTLFIRKKMTDTKKSNIPIIAITAHDPADYAVNLDTYGFSGFISKPVTIEKLKKTLQELGF